MTLCRNSNNTTTIMTIINLPQLHPFLYGFFIQFFLDCDDLSKSYFQVCVQPSKKANFALEFLYVRLSLLPLPQTPKSCLFTPGLDVLVLGICKRFVANIGEIAVWHMYYFLNGSRRSSTAHTLYYSLPP